MKRLLIICISIIILISMYLLVRPNPSYTQEKEENQGVHKSQRKDLKKNEVLDELSQNEEKESEQEKNDYNYTKKEAIEHKNEEEISILDENNTNTELSIPKESTDIVENIVVESTEWDKLGISEYDYYNMPNDNEGEMVFKGDTSLCQKEINRLVNKYYDLGIDGGNYYTVNGKYTHSYLGCGIKMYMNGNAYTYSQIRNMGFY